MCRWLAYLAPAEECLLEDVLVTPAHSIYKQVNDHYLPNLLSHRPGEITTEQEIHVRNVLNNVDGFGLAWYTDTRAAFMKSTSGARPALYKHSQPPTNDDNFYRICANTSTTCLFAHIRASMGASAVSSINNHPFVFGRHTIMHNGEISNFSLIRREMLQLIDLNAFENIQGSTDSEHFAALYMTYLTKSFSSSSSEPNGSTHPHISKSAWLSPHPRQIIISAWERTYSLAEMKAALTETMRAVIRLQNAFYESHPNYSPPQEPNSLNICITDGTQLIASRYRNHETEQPPSLYYSTTAGVTLNRKYPDSPDGPTSLTTDQSAHSSIVSRTISAPTLPERGSQTSLATGGTGAGMEDGKKPPSRHGAHVIVASEPSTYKVEEWKLIDKNTVVLVDSKGAVTVESLEVEM